MKFDKFLLGVIAALLVSVIVLSGAYLMPGVELPETVEQLFISSEIKAMRRFFTLGPNPDIEPGQNRPRHKKDVPAESQFKDQPEETIDESSSVESLESSTQEEKVEEEASVDEVEEVVEASVEENVDEVAVSYDAIDDPIISALSHYLIEQREKSEINDPTVVEEEASIDSDKSLEGLVGDARSAVEQVQYFADQTAGFLSVKLVDSRLDDVGMVISETEYNKLDEGERTYSIGALAPAYNFSTTHMAYDAEAPRDQLENAKLLTLTDIQQIDTVLEGEYTQYDEEQLPEETTTLMAGEIDAERYIRGLLMLNELPDLFKIASEEFSDYSKRWVFDEEVGGMKFSFTSDDLSYIGKNYPNVSIFTNIFQQMDRLNVFVYRDSVNLYGYTLKEPTEELTYSIRWTDQE